MSGELDLSDAWIDAAAEPIWDYSNPEYPIRDGGAWQECRDLARQALEAAAPLIVADNRRQIARNLSDYRNSPARSTEAKRVLWQAIRIADDDTARVIRAENAISAAPGTKGA